MKDWDVEKYDGEYFEWPTEEAFAEMPADASLQSINFLFLQGLLASIQLVYTKGDWPSVIGFKEEYAADYTLEQIEFDPNSPIRAVDASYLLDMGSFNGLRFYDEKGEIIDDIDFH